MQIDTIALFHATKALIVIFIILICLINITLLVKLVRKSKFYQSPKLMTIISLAIGDIMMAMFPLVVMAKRNFDLDLTIIDCTLIHAVVTYYNYLLHFVYGLGLIVLGVEVLVRSKLRSLFNPLITAVAVSGVPWFLGLVIILPVCMSKINYIHCINFESQTTMFTVSVFLPSSLALLMLIIFNFLSLPTYQYQHKQSMNTANFQPTVANLQHEVAQQETIMTTDVNEINVDEAGSNNPHIPCPYRQNSAPVGSHYPHQVYPQLSPDQQGFAQYVSIQHDAHQYILNQQGLPQHTSNQQSVNHYLSNQDVLAQCPSIQQGMAQYPPTQQGRMTYTTNHLTIDQQMQPGNTLYLPDMRRTELQRLLIISILFFIMVVPIAALNISIESVVVDDQRLTVFVATQLLNWLMIARSCLTPLIMISYSDM